MHWKRALTVWAGIYSIELVRCIQGCKDVASQRIKDLGRGKPLAHGLSVAPAKFLVSLRSYTPCARCRKSIGKRCPLSLLASASRHTASHIASPSQALNLEWKLRRKTPIPRPTRRKTPIRLKTPGKSKPPERRRLPERRPQRRLPRAPRLRARQARRPKRPQPSGIRARRRPRARQPSLRLTVPRQTARSCRSSGRWWTRSSPQARCRISTMPS